MRLSNDFLVSKFAFQFSVYRYIRVGGGAAVERAVDHGRRRVAHARGGDQRGGGALRRRALR